MKTWTIVVDIDETYQEFTADVDATTEAEARELMRQEWNRKKERRLRLAPDTKRIVNIWNDDIVFNNFSEVVDYVLESLGSYSEDFDVEAIAREIYDWEDGKMVLTVTSTNAFNEICQRHDIS